MAIDWIPLLASLTFGLIAEFLRWSITLRVCFELKAAAPAGVVYWCNTSFAFIVLPIGSCAAISVCKGSRFLFFYSVWYISLSETILVSPSLRLAPVITAKSSIEISSGMKGFAVSVSMIEPIPRTPEGWSSPFLIKLVKAQELIDKS